MAVGDRFYVKTPEAGKFTISATPGGAEVTVVCTDGATAPTRRRQLGAGDGCNATAQKDQYLAKIDENKSINPNLPRKPSVGSASRNQSIASLVLVVATWIIA